ncbi:uncharacterized protein LOC133908942 [Phragmites australis]|uniref:uncharacterized protein LOC133908942 n=1 Tax=Phragmites australis TaxID=29695 RepID=UPI002D77915F|nr:uncharacterized protein LOC133908942 [Phragmites australis]
MAADAQAEGPAPAEKRALSGDGGEEERRPPEPKRGRACVAALDGVPGGGAGGGGRACLRLWADDASFSFQHARAGFVALETTPKIGSFNPPAAALPSFFDLLLLSSNHVGQLFGLFHFVLQLWKA